MEGGLQALEEVGIDAVEGGVEGTLATARHRARLWLSSWREAAEAAALRSCITSARCSRELGIGRKARDKQNGGRTEGSR